MKKRKDTGSFWFQLTQNGNLVGEFIDNVKSNVFTESADRKKGMPASFRGIFDSTWLESRQAIKMELNIQPGGYQIFELRWLAENRIRYYGEAFLAGDGKLTGTYWVAGE